MKKFLDWLEREPGNLKDLLDFILGCLICNLIFSFAGAFFVENFLGVNLPEPSPKTVELIFSTFPIGLMFIVLVEEFIFRFIPLALSVYIWGVSKFPLFIAIFSSIVFGAVHGSFYNIFIQGISGAIFCIVFLKLGGFSGFLLKPLLASFSVHFAFDGLLFTVFLLWY